MNYAFKMMAVTLLTFGISGCAEYLVAEAVLATVSAIEDNTKKSKTNSYSKPYNPSSEKTCYNTPSMCSDFSLCLHAAAGNKWENESKWALHVNEAKSRSLDCGVKDNKSKNTYASLKNKKSKRQILNDIAMETKTSFKKSNNKSLSSDFNVTKDEELFYKSCEYRYNPGKAHGFFTRDTLVNLSHLEEFQKRGKSCSSYAIYLLKKNKLRATQGWHIPKDLEDYSKLSISVLCNEATRYLPTDWKKGNILVWNEYKNNYVKEAKKRGLNCGVNNVSKRVYSKKFIKLKFDLDKNLIKFNNYEKSREIFLDISSNTFYYHSGNNNFTTLHENIYYFDKNDVGRYSILLSDEKILRPIPWSKPKSLKSVISSTGKKYIQVIVNDFEDLELQTKENFPYLHVHISYQSKDKPSKWSGWWLNTDYNFERRQSFSKLYLALKKNNSSKIATSISSAELKAERRKRIELERKLAAMEAKQKQEKQIINIDTEKPIISAFSKVDGSNALISGRVTDNTKVIELTIDGEEVRLKNNGTFETELYIPRSGLNVEIVAYDKKGNKAFKLLKLERSNIQQASGPTFDKLDPSGKRVKSNPNALALIIGISDYSKTKADAVYADKDAQQFYDYATMKLGIPSSNIKELVNDKADLGEILINVKDWLRRSAKPNKSDIYIYFAGHGLASQDGTKMYLLPYDGRPRLLENTALLRDELFKDIKQANPRSVIVFLDTCYSGVTRNEEMLIAGRPIVIKAKEQAIPDGFTLFSAASNEQISRPLEEAKHGMFSYFLMKGMEGDADANKDNKITARELHSYVEQNVVQQSSGSQTPELQGDKDRVLVKFN